MDASAAPHGTHKVGMQRPAPPRGATDSVVRPAARTRHLRACVSRPGPIRWICSWPCAEMATWAYSLPDYLVMWRLASRSVPARVRASPVARLQEVYDRLVALHPTSLGKSTSKEERERRQMAESTLVYGEIKFEPFATALLKVGADARPAALRR